MSELIRFKNLIGRLIDTKQDNQPYLGGLLGTYINGSKVVRVPNQPGYVYVRLGGQYNEIITAFNNSVSEVFDLKVIVTIKPSNPGIYVIDGLDIEQYATTVNSNGNGASSYLPHHGGTHSFGIGVDPVFIYKRQMMQPMGTHPTNPISNHLTVEGDYYIWQNTVKYFPGANTVSFLPAKPASPNFGRYITVYLDGSSNSLGYITGSDFSVFPFLATGIANYIPVPAANVGIPLAAIFLNSGSSTFDWGSIKDIRTFLSSGEIVGGGTAPYLAQWLSGSVLGNSPLIVNSAMTIHPSGASNGQGLVFDGTYWVPGTAGSGGAGGGSNTQFTQTNYGGGDITLGTTVDGGWVDVDATNAAISLVPNLSGTTYQATFNFTHYAQWAVAGRLNISFRLTDGTNTSATEVIGLHPAFDGEPPRQHPVSISSLFTWTITGTQTIKLQKQITDIATITTNIVLNNSLHMEVFSLGGSDHKVAVSSTDTVANYLQNKLVAGTNIAITKNSSGGNETLTIAFTGTSGGGGSGNIVGTGSANHIAYWDSPTSIQADPQISIDNSAHRIAIGAGLADLPVSTFTASFIAARTGTGPTNNRDSGFSAVAWTNTGSASPFFNGIRARGSAGNPQKVLNGDRLVDFAARGYYDDGAGSHAYTNEVGQLLFIADEDFDDPFTWGAHAAIRVVPTGSDTLVTAFEVYPDRIKINGSYLKLDNNIEIDPTSALNGHVLTYNSSSQKWVPQSVTGSSSSSSFGWFNVMDYGATGNGSTDDTAAINLAIVAANASPKAAVLYFPGVAAYYKITSQLTAITNYTLIMGDGWGSSDIRLNSTTATAFVANTSRAIFRDISIENNSGGTVTAGNAIYITGSGNPTIDIENVRVASFYVNIKSTVNVAWHLQGGFNYNPVLYGLQIQNNVNADAGDYSISEVVFSADVGSPTAAIYIETSGGCKIINSKVNGSGNFIYGMYLHALGTTGQFMVDNCSLENWATNGILIDNSGATWKDLIIRGNQFGTYGSQTGAGIKINSANVGDLSEVVIIGNSFRGVSGQTYAINLTKVNNARIGSNVFTGYVNLLTTTSCTNIVLDSPLTTKGDIFTFSTVGARLGVGSDGQVLTADSTQTNGIKWAASGGGGGSSIAANVTITDVADYYTSANVEGALQEIGLAISHTSEHDHGVTRLNVLSGTSNIALFDFVKMIEYVSFNGSMIDPLTYSINTGSDYVILDSVLTNTGVIIVGYQILSL